MENEFDNMEDWLKRKLQDTEPVWSEEAWNDFENRRNDKRRRVLWIYFTFAAFMITIGGTLLYNNINTSNKLAELKNTTKTMVKIEAAEKSSPSSKFEVKNLGNTTNLLPAASNNSVYQAKPGQAFVKPFAFSNNNDIYSYSPFDAKNEYYQKTISDFSEKISNTNKVEQNIKPQEEIPVVKPVISKPTEVEVGEQAPAPIDKPATPNTPIKKLDDKKLPKKDGPHKPYEKKTYIAFEYNPSQIIFASDISIPTTNYINAAISKNALVYNNFGIAVGRFINKKISIQSGVSLYSYTANLNYTEQIEKNQLVASPYTSFRMDTVLRRINKHTDTIYTTVTDIQNVNHQTKVQLQYISIPLNVLYTFKCKSALIGIGGGLAVQHLQKVAASDDYNDDVKISPWKMNANLQFDAGWKLYKSLSIYTGYNIGYGFANKNNYIQQGLRTGLKIKF